MYGATTQRAMQGPFPMEYHWRKHSGMFAYNQDFIMSIHEYVYVFISFSLAVNYAAK